MIFKGETVCRIGVDPFSATFDCPASNTPAPSGITPAPTTSPTSLPPTGTTTQTGPSGVPAQPSGTPEIPAAYVGTWTGRGSQDNDSYIKFSLRLTITGGKVGELIGTATYDGTFSCQRDLELQAVSRDRVSLYQEDSACRGGNDVELVFDNGGLKYGSRNQGEPDYWIHATLSKR